MLDSERERMGMIPLNENAEARIPDPRDSMPEERITVTQLLEKLAELQDSGWGEAIVHAYEGEESGLNVFMDIDNPDGVIFIRTGP